MPILINALLPSILNKPNSDGSDRSMILINYMVVVVKDLRAPQQIYLDNFESS